MRSPRLTLAGVAAGAVLAAVLVAPGTALAASAPATANACDVATGQLAAAQSAQKNEHDRLTTDSNANIDLATYQRKYDAKAGVDHTTDTSKADSVSSSDHEDSALDTANADLAAAHRRDDDPIADLSVAQTAATKADNAASDAQSVKDAVCVTATTPPVTTTLAPPPASAGPIAHDDTYSTPKDVTLSVSGPGLLGNDTDVDPRSLSVTAPGSESTAHGSVSVHPNGSFTYIPAQGYTGPDSFRYTITDGNGLTSPATAFITVGAATVGGSNGGGNLNCAQLADRGLHNIHIGNPYYRPALDTNNDGIACETAPPNYFKIINGRRCHLINGAWIPVDQPATPGPVVLAPAPTPVYTIPAPVIINQPAPSGGNFSQIGTAPTGSISTGDASLATITDDDDDALLNITVLIPLHLDH